MLLRQLGTSEVIVSWHEVMLLRTACITFCAWTACEQAAHRLWFSAGSTAISKITDKPTTQSARSLRSDWPSLLFKRSSVGQCVRDYKSIHVAVMICATLVNRQIALTSYTISWTWAKNGLILWLASPSVLLLLYVFGLLSVLTGVPV